MKLPVSFTPANSLDAGPIGTAIQRDRRLVFVIAVLLAIGTGILYAPALRNGFVNYDDPDYVTRNSQVLQGLTWPNIVWAFGTNNPAANWHPLTWISHMLDVHWYGTNATGHHFTNVLLYALDVGILFLVLEWMTGLALRSAAVAALYALHPLNVESVAWVAERKAVLSLLFLLLTLCAYVWYSRRPGVERYLAVVLFFTLALMAKIMVISLPLALLLLDYWPLHRFSSGAGEPQKFSRTLSALVAEKIPLLLLSIAGGAMTLYVHGKEGALTKAMPLNWRLKNVIYSYLAYLGKAIWPTRLAVFYPHPENSLPWWEVIAAGVSLLAISGIVWRLHAKRYLTVGWLWYLGTMFPMIGLVQSGRQGAGDRYMCIPLLGLLLAVVWLVAELATRLRIKEALTVGVFAILALPYAHLTRQQIGYWRDSYTLFAHTLQVTTNNGIAENNFGSALMEMREPQMAAPHFEAAVRLIPELASAHYNLGVVLQTQNRAEEAARQYQLAISTAADPLVAAQAHNNLGVMYLQVHDSASAMTELSAAIALNPDEMNSYMGRGMIELQSWNLDAAIADFSRATEISPSPVSCYWLGRALETKGDLRRAASAYATALQMSPGMTDARTRLAALQAKSGGSR